MFERFTDRARRVIVLAQEEARLLNHAVIGSEHLLLGLIYEGEGVAAKALDEEGLTLELVRTQVERLVPPGDVEMPQAQMPFQPEAKKVLELALRDALQLGHNYVGTEHILLGLIREGTGVGAQALVNLGVDLTELRSDVIRILGGYSRGGRGTPAAEDADWAAVLVVADVLNQEKNRDALKVIAALRRLGWTPPNVIPTNTGDRYASR